VEKVIDFGKWLKKSKAGTVEKLLESPENSAIKILDPDEGEPPHRINPLEIDMRLLYKLLPPMTKKQSSRMAELFVSWKLDLDADLYRVVRRAVNCDLGMECGECSYEEKCMDLNVVEAAAVISLLENPGMHPDKAAEEEK